MNKGNLHSQFIVYGGKKYLCGSCDYQAAQRGHLKTHQQLVHVTINKLQSSLP